VWQGSHSVLLLAGSQPAAVNFQTDGETAGELLCGDAADSGALPFSTTSLRTHGGAWSSVPGRVNVVACWRRRRM